MSYESVLDQHIQGAKTATVDLTSTKEPKVNRGIFRYIFSVTVVWLLLSLAPHSALAADRDGELCSKVYPTDSGTVGRIYGQEALYRMENTLEGGYEDDMLIYGENWKFFWNPDLTEMKGLLIFDNEALGLPDPIGSSRYFGFRFEPGEGSTTHAFLAESYIEVRASDCNNLADTYKLYLYLEDGSFLEEEAHRIQIIRFESDHDQLALADWNRSGDLITELALSHVYSPDEPPESYYGNRFVDVTSPKLTIELEPKSEIVCSDQGKLILPVDVTAANNTGETLNGLTVEVQVEGFAKDKEKVAFDDLVEGASLTEQVDLPIAEYVQSTKDDGLLNKFTITATASTATVDDAAKATKKVDNVTLHDPRQYVTNIFREAEQETDNSYWLDRSMLTSTGDPYRFTIRFSPQCGTVAAMEAYGDSGARIPLRTLAKELGKETGIDIDHFNWVQTFKMPSNITTYRIDKCQGCMATTVQNVPPGDDQHPYGQALAFGENILISCTRLQHAKNAFSYIRKDENGQYAYDGDVPLNAVDILYDPAVTDYTDETDPKHVQTYAFKVDGDELDDICWQLWPNPDPDPYPPVYDSTSVPLVSEYAAGKNYVKHSDGPRQMSFVLSFRKQGDQFVRFETNLVGVTEKEELVAIYDGITWKSNTIITPEGLLTGRISPTGQSDIVDGAYLEGGIFDFGRIDSDNAVYLPVITTN